MSAECFASVWQLCGGSTIAVVNIWAKQRRQTRLVEWGRWVGWENGRMNGVNERPPLGKKEGGKRDKVEQRKEGRDPRSDLKKARNRV